MATRPARAATRREIDSLIRVHPYSDPTTAQSITTPSGYRASRIRCGVGFLFLPSSRRAPAEFTQTKPKSVRHFIRSRNGVYVRHERTQRTSTSISPILSLYLLLSFLLVHTLRAVPYTLETLLLHAVLPMRGKRSNRVLGPDFRLQTG